MICAEDFDEIINNRLDNLLRPHQKEAVDSLSNGSILYGGVGAGKSLTAIAYYMKKEFGRDIVIITTAKKRDSREWHDEAARLGLGPDPDVSIGGALTVDSWNNIGRYTELQECFFIFDEQRLVGSGAWVKSFQRIVRDGRNRWILLTATPGDSWIDYAPVFIARNWYKNITDFKRQHVVYAPYVKFPIIQRYIGTEKLERLRAEILVEMPYVSKAERIVNYIDVGYPKEQILSVQKNRWNPITDEPVRDVAELWRLVRTLVNSDQSRKDAIEKLHKAHPRLIVFYNFDYELDILRTVQTPGKVLEWNGHKHEYLPGRNEPDQSWLYLVQYQAGAEGWNCTTTDAIAFYSMTYSYKNWAQSMGRIDRLDTPYDKLYYYVLKSGAFIDQKLVRVLQDKKDFNERDVLKDWISHDDSAGL